MGAWKQGWLHRTGNLPAEIMYLQDCFNLFEGLLTLTCLGSITFTKKTFNCLKFASWVSFWGCNTHSTFGCHSKGSGHLEAHMSATTLVMWRLEPPKPCVSCSCCKHIPCRAKWRAAQPSQQGAGCWLCLTPITTECPRRGGLVSVLSILIHQY